MIFSFVKNSLRVLWHHRFNAMVNIIGLSVGVASCLFIFLYVQNELSYDKQHLKRNRIYRIVSDLNLGGEDDKSGMSSYMLSPTIKADYPEVEEAVRVMPVGKQTMWVDDKPYQFNDNIMSDSGFFSVFDYEFIEGDPLSALAQPQSVVITDEVALKMFGKTTGVLGSMIKYARQSYNVTGVVRDYKDKSHLYFNTILSLNSLQPQYEARLRGDWFYLAQTNYVLFRNETAAASFEQKLAGLRDKYIVPWLKQVNSQGKITFKLQALPDIHLSGDYATGYTKTGNKSYIYIFSILAFFILLIACINYINLATATSFGRAKEIGIRKTAGASPGMLFAQFLSESVVTALIAVVTAIVWLHLFLPMFNQITEKSLSVSYSPGFMTTLLGVVVVIGLFAGAYPAMVLSRLQPAVVVKSAKVPGRLGAWFSKSLVVVQFLIALLFIISTLVVYAQMSYLRSANLGFNKDQLLVLSVPVPDTSFMNKFDVVKHELEQHSDITNIAMTNSVPGVPTGTLIHAIETPEHQTQEKAIDFMMVSHDFIPVMEIPLVSGRNFSTSFTTDDTAAFIINETAAKTYGWKDPLNYVLENGFGYKGRIVGVVRDFNYKSLHEPVQPLVMMLGGRLQGNLLLRIKAGKEQEIIRHVETVWSKYSKKYPTEYFFLDDNYEKLYRSEKRMLMLLTIFSVISLIISGMGLYAMVTYSVEQRVKEIGIRKVMGASVINIVSRFNFEYLILMGMAMVIATPVAIYFMQRWLNDFAYRIELSPAIIIIGTLFVVALSIITVTMRVLRAAVANPVESLRYE